MRSHAIPAVLALLLFLAGCGDSIEPSAPGVDSASPRALRALSRDEGTVRLEWLPPLAFPDSLLAGWVITWPGGGDSLDPAVRAVEVDSLPPGPAAFEVRTREAGGAVSPPASIRWAPARRYEGPYTLTEYYASDPGRAAGFDVGERQRAPSAFPIVAGDPAVAAAMDLYLFGGEGEVEAPLALRSASLFLGAWNVTLFSSVHHASPDLEFPLDRFPDESTFTLASVDITDSTIYYLRAAGGSGAVHYARIHVQAAGGPQRNRSVRLSVSLQEQSGVPFAERRTSLSLSGAKG